MVFLEFGIKVTNMDLIHSLSKFSDTCEVLVWLEILLNDDW